jgi:hypothetical protein
MRTEIVSLLYIHCNNRQDSSHPMHSIKSEKSVLGLTYVSTQHCLNLFVWTVEMRQVCCVLCRPHSLLTRWHCLCHTINEGGFRRTMQLAWGHKMRKGWLAVFLTVMLSSSSAADWCWVRHQVVCVTAAWHTVMENSNRTPPLERLQQTWH